MDCPRCKLNMSPTETYRGSDAQHRRADVLRTITHASGVEIEECAGCGGVFLDAGELKKIQSAAKHTKSNMIPPTAIQRAYERGRQRSEHGDSLPSLTCPSCSGEMLPRDWGFGTEVTIDTCLECFGVWLDFTELESLEDFFR